ncbi:formate dehydrogenase subunit delta [Pseudochrobactrum sp. MP213Fo]|uniref:formate dehydrogenase subunit delta n=1 Tax=Pseudochrobactrum sp. MP213Fo TaxID=3022250 RepID=UPI003B9EBDE8
MSEYRSRIPMMASQIATFFTSQPEEVQAEGVAKHINMFWEPRMRNQLFDLIDAGGEGLHPLVMAAAPHIKRPEK